MTRRTCPRCGAEVNAASTRLKVLSSRRDDDQGAERVYCPHYQHGQVTPEAFEIAFNQDDCFKDSYSCCYCSHRILEQDGGNYCPYEHLDDEARNFFYRRPITHGINHSEDIRQLSLAYWTCTVCKSHIEISRKES